MSTISCDERDLSAQHGRVMRRAHTHDSMDKEGTTSNDAGHMCFQTEYNGLHTLDSTDQQNNTHATCIYLSPPATCRVWSDTTRDISIADMVVGLDRSGGKGERDRERERGI